MRYIDSAEHDVPIEVQAPGGATMPRQKPFHIYSPQSMSAAVRHYRKMAGLTQQALAESAGTERKYVSRLESSKEPEQQLGRLLRIFRELGVRITLEQIEPDPKNGE